jgi:hypothetical protein
MNGLSQSSQHAFNLKNPLIQWIKIGLLQELKITGKQQVIFQVTR